MTGVPFVNRRYMKGPFLSKRVYERIRGETSVGGGGEGRVSPSEKFVEYLPGRIHT